MAHRGVVLGLFSAFGFQVYQIFSKTYEGRVDSPHMHSTYLKGQFLPVEVSANQVKCLRTDRELGVVFAMTGKYTPS